MRRPVRTFLIAGALVALAGAGTAVADAAWLIPGTPTTVALTTVDMPRGPVADAVKDKAAAIITWDRQEIAPDVVAHDYVVRRHDVAGRAPVKTFAPTAKSTLTDTDVPAGTWYWTVTSRLAGWAGAESRPGKPVAFRSGKAPATRATAPSSEVIAPVPGADPPTAEANGPAAAPAPAATTTAPKAVDPTSASTTTSAPVAEQTEVVEPASPATTPAMDDQD